MKESTMGILQQAEELLYKKDVERKLKRPTKKREYVVHIHNQ